MKINHKIPQPGQALEGGRKQQKYLRLHCNRLNQRNDVKEYASAFYALLSIAGVSAGLRPFCASSLNLMGVCAPSLLPGEGEGEVNVWL